MAGKSGRNTGIKKPAPVGFRKGMLVVTGEADPVIKSDGLLRRRLLCRCDCGNTASLDYSGVLHGNTKSCGCLNQNRTKGFGEKESNRNFRHGHTDHGKFSPTYLSWLSMKRRCNTPDPRNRKWYFDKGIKYCDRWSDFTNFLKDMGERPEGMTLDRIDSDKDYSPDNCRWATAKQQIANRSNMKK